MSNFLKDSPLPLFLLLLEAARKRSLVTINAPETSPARPRSDGEEGRSSDESRDEKAEGALCASIPQSTEVLQQMELRSKLGRHTSFPLNQFTTQGVKASSIYAR